MNTIIIRDADMRNRAAELISRLDLAKPWEVTIKRHTKRRTLRQNNLYWAWIQEIVKHVHEHTGHGKDEIHEWCKQQFLTPKIVEIAGKTCEFRSTAKLDTIEMKDYGDKVYWWAASTWGLVLPLPEELQRMDR